MGGPLRSVQGAAAEARRRWPSPKGLVVLLFALALVVTPPELAPAQDLASLVADSVAISGEDTLTATGNVEVFYQGQTLQASKIVYDKTSDRLDIEGPITLKDGAGTLILASQADLAADLSDGVLRSARVVLDERLQLSSSEVSRVDGRYTAFGRSVVSSCKVCRDGQTPLWEIRARRIVHDEEARQIYFDNAQLRFFGVPVAYVPRLRIPDPSLDRARGFLRPAIRSTSVLGFGVEVPYFIPLGPSRDLTLTPWLATKNAQSLGFRYRQAFRTGRLVFAGAISHDDLLENEPRFYGTVDGTFGLPRGFVLGFTGAIVSDRNYLRDYGISDADRLASQVAVTRTRRLDYIDGRLVTYRSLRVGEAFATLPSVTGDVTWIHRFTPLGGAGSFTAQTHSDFRSSNDPADRNLDGIGDGSDTVRLSLGADFRRTLVLPGGILAAGLAEIRADDYRIRQDTVYGGDRARLFGGVATEFRWPLVRAGTSGASQVIEPVVQLIWAPTSTRDVPNADSRLVEFDEGNLFSFSRYPGHDAVELGPRANVGLQYTLLDPTGWSLSVLGGRVFRPEDYGQFGVASGLRGQTSDWLTAVQVSFAGGFSATNRLVFDDDLGLTKAEMRVALYREKFGVTSNYVMVLPDPSESRPTRASELSLAGGYQFTPFWRSDVTSRYDFEARRLQSTGLRVGFKNECLKMDVAVARSLTSSSAVRASTNFNLSVDLLGFGGKALPGPSRTCRG